MTDLLVSNLLSPMVLAFFLGLLAIIIKSDLKIPEALYVGLSIYLMFAIGLKGGAALSVTPFAEVWRPGLATLILGVITPLLAFLAANRLLRFDRTNASALAAHYGSVSAVTFMASLTWLSEIGEPTEGYLPALVAILEIPAIVLALMVVQMRSHRKRREWSRVLGEVLSLKSILLLFGGLLIGLVSGTEGLERVAPFFVDPFQGVLAFFLIEMGVLAGQRLSDLKRVGIALIGFAIVIPVIHGFLGAIAGHLSGMSVGGTAVLATLTASASYIAAPAAVRVSLPRANPTLYLTGSLAITFPFNIIFGIPLYYQFARWIAG